MLKITENVDLKELSGLKVGVGQATLYEVGSYDDFEDLLLKVSNDELKKMILVGDGTNTVFVNTQARPINLLKIGSQNINEPVVDEKRNETLFSVGAGVNWDYFVQKYIELGGVGMEQLSMIPGTVGAAPVQNIGAYGKEVSEFIHSVYVYNLETREFELMLKENCNFSYRNSIFKQENKQGQNKYIILSVNFILKTEDQNNISVPDYKDIQNALFNKDKIREASDFWTLKLPENIEELKNKKYTVEEIRRAIVLVRANKLPDPSIVPNCGSFFANPIITRSELKKVQQKFPKVPVFAVVGMGDKAKEEDEKVKIPIAYIVEKIGLKGYNSNFDTKNESGEIGNFGIYKNHALIVVSNGKGTVTEFLEFIKFIKQKVYEASGLKIIEEVNLI